jgi:hypothetical protein
MVVPLTVAEKDAGGRRAMVAYPPGLLSRRVTARGRSITLGPASFDRNPSDPFSNCMATSVARLSPLQRDLSKMNARSELSIVYRLITVD